MRFVQKLPDANELIKENPLTAEEKSRREELLSSLRAILSGKDGRKILCIGPCSADREDAVLEYVCRLASLREKVKDVFLIIPRIYTSKPRSTGTGYKGMLHRPAITGKDDILAGVTAVRSLHLKVIRETGFFGADEMLYPESAYYIFDLLSYIAVGARSVEDQGHRMAASGLDIPVGMKNPLSGDMTAVLNSVLAAQTAQTMIYRGWEVQTDGNAYAHAILRGYSDVSGKARPNYHYESLCEFYDLYSKMALKNISVMIDCNHGNSGKHYEEQIRIAKEVLSVCRDYPSLNRFVKGLMIESYLEDGSQILGGGVFGKSVTDPCLGWDKTERLVLELAEMRESG